MTHTDTHTSRVGGREREVERMLILNNEMTSYDSLRDLLSISNLCMKLDIENNFLVECKERFLKKVALYDNAKFDK